MIRVLINGAKGRMGREVVRAVSEDEQLDLVGEADAGDDLVWVRDALGGDGEVQVRLWPLAPGEEAECPG